MSWVERVRSALFRVTAATEARAGGAPDEGRRRAAALVVGLVSAAAAAVALPRRLWASGAPADAREAGATSRHRWGMAIDLDLCTACGACVVACRTENNVPCAGPGAAQAGTAISWMTLLPSSGEEEHGERPMETLPIPCMHCEDPPCVKVCPVGATYVTAEGITAQIYDRCIGCRYCMVACPYSVRSFNWGEPSWPESYRSYINPDVSTRPRGVVEKCTFCHHRIQRAKEESRLAGEPLADAALQHLPACAEACPAGAIVFGDLADAQSRVSRLHRNPRAFRLLENLGTRPKVAYLARDRREAGS